MTAKFSLGQITQVWDQGFVSEITNYEKEKLGYKYLW